MAVFGGLAVLGVSMLWQNREPRYLGRTVTQWLREMINGDDQAGRVAMQAMGSRAVPVLIRDLKSRDSSLRNGYIRFANALPGPVAVHLPGNIEAEHWRKSALRALQLIGTNASAALPSLIDLISDPASPVRREAIEVAVAVAVGASDQERMILTLSELLEEVRESPDNNLFDLAGDAALALATYGKAASNAVPILVELLKLPVPTTPEIRRATTRHVLVALGEIGLNTPDVLEAVRAHLRRTAGAEAFFRLTGDSGPLLEVCRKESENGNDLPIRPDVITALGAAADPLLPHVIHMIEEVLDVDPFTPSDIVLIKVVGGVHMNHIPGFKPFDTRSLVPRIEERFLPTFVAPWELLAAFGSRAFPLRQELAAGMSELEPMSRVEMAHALWHLGTAPDKILPALVRSIEELEDDLGFPTWYALEVLGEIGPPARSASPAVEAVLAMKETWRHDMDGAASNALRRFRGEGELRCFAPSRELVK